MARSPARRDDRYGRERRDDRGYRHRSRSGDRHVGRHFFRSPHRGRGRDLIWGQRRYDNRDSRENYGRLDRPYDRPDEYRGSRRERSRERKRSREASPVRDRRDDRDRRPHDRDYRDDRDRKRSRRDEASPRRPRRDDSKDRKSERPSSSKSNEVCPTSDLLLRRTVLNKQPPKPSPAEAAEEDRKNKLAKVEAWKKRLEEKKRLGAEANGSSSPQVKVEGTSTAASPDMGSPANLSQPTTGPASPAPPKDGEKSAPPAPYAGKFDPKAIAKRAAAAMERHKAALGGDITIPKSASEAPNLKGSTLADNSKVAPASRVNGESLPFR